MLDFIFRADLKGVLTALLGVSGVSEGVGDATPTAAAFHLGYRTALAAVASAYDLDIPRLALADEGVRRPAQNRLLKTEEAER